ncbi:MAG: class D beta-lactamase [Aquamicrobium sp.]|nr:class D beta-lactamase [Aquamicrobium sp.]
MKFVFPSAMVLLALLAVRPAEARNICTIVADATSGAVLHEDGDCQTRVTPASTFKVALALMGYDAGYLQDSRSPVLPFKEGYPSWGGENWTQPTDPTRWMKYSVVWYSQQIAKSLGAERMTDYGVKLGYGNADFTGDPGRNNGLERSWIGSSLKISPREQVGFLQNFLNRKLPVNAAAIDRTIEVVESTTTEGGWTVSGKTGSAYPRNADGSLNRARGWGWFVGWATRDDAVVVFARLDQDEKRQKRAGGLRARDAFLKAWPTLAAQAVR